MTAHQHIVWRMRRRKFQRWFRTYGGIAVICIALAVIGVAGLVEEIAK